MKTASAYLVALTVIVVGSIVAVRQSEKDASRTGAPEASLTAISGPTPSASGKSDGRSPPSEWVGVLLGRRTVDVGPRVASLVRSVTARAGENVPQGAVLATLEARERAYAVKAATAAERGQAGRAARTARLRTQALVSDEEADLARYDAEQKSAELNVARVLAEDGIIRAPFAGTVVVRTAEPGAFVGAGFPMFRLVDTAGARIRFGVSTEVATKLTLGQPVSFRIDGEAPLRGGRVSTISAEVDRSAELVVIEADVPEPGIVRSGVRVRVYLDGRQQ